MKSKYAGKCVKTGRRFGVGANVKFLGKGKGCVLLDSCTESKSYKSKSWDGNPYNEAGEPMMNATQYRQACQADEQDAWDSHYDR